MGFVAELDPVESSAVLYLRMWCDGPDAQAQVWNDFATMLGPEAGQQALRSFEALCDLCACHARRPLMRHSVTCKCLGADEACFANFVGYASEGEREDALLIATTMVRPGMAPALVACAQQVGLALKRITSRIERRQKATHPPTYH